MGPCANIPEVVIELCSTIFGSTALDDLHLAQSLLYAPPTSYSRMPFQMLIPPITQSHMNKDRQKACKIQTETPLVPCIFYFQFLHSSRISHYSNFSVENLAPWLSQNQKVLTLRMNQIQYSLAVSRKVDVG
jgi:hypothetical protein